MRPVRGGYWWALAAVVAPLLWAGPAAADTTLEIEAGYAGSFIPGQEVPVRVRISADRLIRGTLEVGIGNVENASPVAMAVEVPGGSQKQFVVTAPAGMNQSPDVVVRVHQDDRVIASGKVGIRAAGDTELAGILPGALRNRPVPGVAPLAVDVGTARFAAIAFADLEGAPATLGPLSTLLADTDEIGRLSAGARTGVLRWLQSGGRLLVDSAKGQPVPGLPDAWQPKARGRAAAGLGEVVATDGAIAAGRWWGLVEPSSRGTVSARFVGELPLATTLAADAGLRTPEIGWLVGFLAVYVIVVGPVLFFAVRRRKRPELAWIAVPLVAIVFSTGSYVVGRNLRKATQLVHATVLSSGPEGPVATTYVGVFSRCGETARIGFPAGWSSGQFADTGQSAATPSLVTLTAEGPDARLPLDSGQFGMVYGSGPAPGAGGLEITSAGNPGGPVIGTVRNPTPFKLDDVAVFTGADATLVGSLGPGEERTFAVANNPLLRGGGGGAEFRVWISLQTGDQNAAADFGLWQAALRMGGLNFLSPDAAVAAGWTRDYVPDIRAGGSAAKPKGRTLVLGRQHIDPVAQGASTFGVRRDIVRDPFATRVRGGGPLGSVARFVLADGVDTSKLVLNSPFGAAEFWQEGAWQSATCAGPACGNARGGVVGCPPGVDACPQPFVVPAFPGASQFAVPPGAVRDGVIYARIPGPSSIDQSVAFTIGRAQ